MNEITRNFWDRGLTLRKWATLNGFSWRYVELVITGKRGSWNVGTAKKIKEALVDQGFATQDQLKNNKSN